MIARHRQSCLCACHRCAQVFAFALLLVVCVTVPLCAQTNPAPAPPSQPKLSKIYEDCVHDMYPDSGPANDCLNQEYTRHITRLSKLNQEHVAQLANDQDATDAFRADRRKWVDARNNACNTRMHPTLTTQPTKSDFTRCLIAETDSRADYVARLIRGDAAAASATDETGGPHVPFQLWGKWTVSKILPVSTVSCWDQKQSDAMIGTEIEYSANSFRWKDNVTRDPAAKTETITDQKFTEDHSGSGSFVNFKQLGIGAPSATQITITHPNAEITGATTEIPGDTVVVVDATHIVFSLCNMYFLAVKE